MTDLPPAGDDAPAGPPEAPRRRRRLSRVLLVLGLVVAVVVGAGAVYAIRLERSVTSNITRAPALPTDSATTPGASPRPTKQETGALNYVLLGSDSRDTGDEGNGRSDTIMVAHLNAARTKAYLISFPRDMWVTVPGHGKNKINAAYAFGGPPLTVRTLEDLTGVRMDHVVLVDFQGFIALTDDLGGVTVTNKTAFRSHGYDYPKGKITVSGKKALWFVRERHALPGGDLDRAENQRNVVKAIIAKGLSAETVADPARFTAFVGHLARDVTVDDTLTDADITRTALSLRLSGSDIESLQAPISGLGTIAGQSVDVVDTAQLAELSAALKRDTMDAYVAKHPKG